MKLPSENYENQQLSRGGDPKPRYWGDIGIGIGIGLVLCWYWYWYLGTQHIKSS
jgi:hypothetical protein